MKGYRRIESIFNWVAELWSLMFVNMHVKAPYLLRIENKLMIN